MGVNLTWQADVQLTLAKLSKDLRLKTDHDYQIIQLNDKVYIHLVSLTNNFDPHQLIELQETYQKSGKLLVHLWEDVWRTKISQVISRISSFLGLNQTIHGRKTKIITLDLKQTINFFNHFHLQGYIKAKYNYGLVIDNELLAAASFSIQRPMQRKGEGYYSAELIRFASKDNLTIVGGLSKLIKHHCKLVKINDIMTYADRDWSLGKGYLQLQFELSATTEPANLYVNEQTGLRYFPHRLPKKLLSAFDEQKELNLDEYLAKQGFTKVFNTGNLKYHLYV